MDDADVDRREHDRSLWVCLTLPEAREAADLVAALRSAYDDVVLPHLEAPCVSWTMSRISRADDLEAPRRPSRAATTLDWEAAANMTDPEVIGVAGGLPADSAIAGSAGYVVHLRLRFPSTGRELDGTARPIPAFLGFRVMQAAMPGGRVSPSLQTTLLDWFHRATEQLGAANGFITVDVVAEPLGATPHEQSAGVLHFWVEPHTELRGYAWGNLLGPQHVQAVGGLDALAACGNLHALSGGRVFLSLTDNVNDVPSEALQRLRDVLAPVLPQGGGHG